MKARYIRVSSQTQSNARQLAKAHPDEKIYVDICSGAIAFNKRPAAQELIEAINLGEIDYISCESIDRIGRDAFNIQETIQFFNSKNVVLKVDNLGIESFAKGKPNPIFKMISDVLANVSELTRNNIKEAQAQGIAIAKALGKFSGKRNKPSASDEEILLKYKSVLKELKQGKNSLRKIAVLCDVSLGTVQKVQAAMKRLEESKKGND